MRFRNRKSQCSHAFVSFPRCDPPTRYRNRSVIASLCYHIAPLSHRNHMLQSSDPRCDIAITSPQCHKSSLCRNSPLYCNSLFFRKSPLYSKIPLYHSIAPFSHRPIISHISHHRLSHSYFAIASSQLFKLSSLVIRDAIP